MMAEDFFRRRIPDRDKASKPAWRAPPVVELGCPVEVPPVLFRGETAAVGLESMVVYSTGLVATIVVIDMCAVEGAINRHRFMDPGTYRTGDVAFGFSFGDGTKVTSTEWIKDLPDSVTGPAPARVMVPRGSRSDTPVRLEQGVFIWPRPTTGFTFVAQWTDAGIPFQSVDLDINRIREASEMTTRF